jgi:hypothetical protein
LTFLMQDGPQGPEGDAQPLHHRPGEVVPSLDLEEHLGEREEADDDGNDVRSARQIEAAEGEMIGVGELVGTDHRQCQAQPAGQQPFERRSFRDDGDGQHAEQRHAEVLWRGEAEHELGEQRRKEQQEAQDGCRQVEAGMGQRNGIDD